MLKTKNRIALAMPVEAWFDVLLASGVACTDLSPRMLIAAAELDAPGLLDPGDRIITATARAYHATILTRDRPILDFAASGHALAIPC